MDLKPNSAQRKNQIQQKRGRVFDVSRVHSETIGHRKGVNVRNFGASFGMSQPSSLWACFYSLYIAKMKLADIQKQLENQTARSAWGRGVLNFAVDMVGDAIENNGADFAPSSSRELEALLLNGAENWKQYSWGGCALVYDGDIAEALCTPSELKKTKNGQRKPNKNEERLDVQARALWQACKKIVGIYARGGKICKIRALLRGRGCLRLQF